MHDSMYGSSSDISCRSILHCHEGSRQLKRERLAYQNEFHCNTFMQDEHGEMSDIEKMSNENDSFIVTNDTVISCHEDSPQGNIGKLLYNFRADDSQ